MDWILSALEARADEASVVEAEREGVRYLFVRASGDRDLQMLPLGFWPDTVEMLRACDMTIMPRTTTVENLNGLRFQAAVLESFAQVNPDLPYLFNSGDAMLGYDEPEQAHDILVDFLQANDVALLATEQMDQSGNVTWGGFDALCDELGYPVVRVFNEWSYIQNRYAYYSYTGPEEITNSLFRAVVERNCRLVYLRAILQKDKDEDYVTSLEDYENMLSSLSTRLRAQGMQQGMARPMQTVAQPFALRLLLGVCVIAAAVLTLCVVFPLRPLWQWLLVAAGGLCVAAAMVVLPNGSKLLLNIGAGVTYPTLTMLCLLRALRERRGEASVWLSCVGGMLLCMLGGVCGGIVSTAALSESAYMLEFRLYRAVKLMQMIPIFCYVLGYVWFLLPEQLGLAAPLRRAAGEGRGSWGRGRKWLAAQLDQPVKLRWAIWTAAVAALLAVAGVVGLYYMARTGNDSVSISSLELMFRNVLETRLLARPRTKEFLIGIPCLMLFIYFWRRSWRLLPFFVGLGMAIGMTSFVNTFLHIRTPLYISFAREGYALLFGLVIGALAIAFFEIVRMLRRKGRAGRV